jgi:pyrrolidone-carboxylate peptidase
VLYTLLHHYHDTNTKVGFVHVPYLPKQAKEGQPCMTTEEIVAALECMIGAI